VEGRRRFLLRAYDDTHLRNAQAPPEGEEWPVNGQIPLTYGPLPAIT